MASRRLSESEQAHFDLVPKHISARAKVVVVRYVPPGFAGITLGDRIMVRPGREQDERLLAHELVHVRQVDELGLARFLVRYLREYVVALVRLRRTHAAYRAISFEVEARDEAARWAERVAADVHDHHERDRA